MIHTKISINQINNYFFDESRLERNCICICIGFKGKVSCLNFTKYVQMATTTSNSTALYHHTVYILNEVILMERTIRAIKQSDTFKAKYQELLKINQDIKDFWISRGIKEEELYLAHVLPVSWFNLQYDGQLPTEYFDLVIDSSIKKIMKESNSELIDRFELRVGEISLGNISPYSYFNLSNTNNIELIIKEFLISQVYIDNNPLIEKRLFENYLDGGERKNDSENSAEIPLGSFIKGLIEPLFVPSKCAMITSGSFKLFLNEVEDRPRVLCDLRVDEPLEKFERILLGITQKYIQERRVYLSNKTDYDEFKLDNDESIREAKLVLNKLMNAAFLNKNKNFIVRMDSFLGNMLGLLAWDLKQQYTMDEVKFKISIILQNLERDTQYNKNIPQDDSVEKYYKHTKKVIDFMANKLNDPNLKGL